MSEFLCVWLPSFRLQAAAGRLPEAAAIASERQGPLELVVAANVAARRTCIEPGMTVTQARGRCTTVEPWPVCEEAERALSRRLQAVAEQVSPRVQMLGSDTALLDFAGLERLQGPAETVAGKLERDFAQAGLTLRVGIAAQPALALVAARGGQRRLPTGGEAAELAALPLGLLAELHELMRTAASAEEVAEALALFERWGLTTLGDLAALPEAGLAARLGTVGTHLRRLALGAVGGLLDTPPEPVGSLHASLEFEPPLADLETLAAALVRDLAALATTLERTDRVVEVVQLELRLEAQAPQRTYTHAFALPTREVKTLAAQLRLALERQPPPAPVVCMKLTLELARPRRIQTRLWGTASPDREKLPKLLGLLGEMFVPVAQRVGSPRLLDTHRSQAFALETYAPPEAAEEPGVAVKEMPLALRVYRPPRSLPAGTVIARRAGPWRSAGGWWGEGTGMEPWTCEEWDAELRMAGGASGLYRLQRQGSDQWHIVGRYD